MAVTMVLAGFTLFAFVKRTMIARWCKKSTVSRRAFRRTLFCMAIYFIIYYFMKNQVKAIGDLQKTIAQAKNISDGGRALQAFDNGFFKNHEEAWQGMMNFKGYNMDDNEDIQTPQEQ